ncbi:MAG: hypothetical protein R3211_09215, partial [Balneolaceae bacterium]|nr:hypothetical protein [Balneolaceae bacterium]
QLRFSSPYTYKNFSDSLVVIPANQMTLFLTIRPFGTESIPPSRTFSDIVILRDSSGTEMIVYEQDPVEDRLWDLKQINRFEFEHTLPLGNRDLK